MDTQFQTMSSDQMSQNVADHIRDLLADADGEMEQAAVLQLVCTTAMHGLADLLSPETVAKWLSGCADIFEKEHVRNRGGLN